MSRAGDKSNRGAREAQEELEKGLSRRNAELAVSGLLRLAPELRAPGLNRVGALFREDVRGAHQRGDWARLGYWAARAEREPRLLGESEGGEVDMTAWALMWGCARTKDFSRARWLRQRLSAALPEHAPELAAALDSYLETGGKPRPELVARLSCEEPAAVDPRLGYEPLRPRRAYPRPGTAEEVERSVLGCRALEPWPVFAATAGDWAASSSAVVARAIRLLAGKLAVLEQLTRAVAAQEARPPSPALLLAEVIREERAPLELSGEALVSFRLVAAELTAAPLVSEQQALAYCTAAAAAAAYPEHRELVAASLAGVRFTPETCRAGLRLFEQLLSGCGTAALVVKAVELSESSGDPRDAPSWLQGAFQRSVESGELTQWLRGAAKRERIDFLTMVGQAMPPRQAERLFDRAWEVADDALRADLVELLESLIGRMQANWALHELRPAMPAVSDLDSLVASLLDEVNRATSLPPEVSKLWQRVEARALPGCPRLLELSLTDARSPAQARQAIERCLGENARMEARLEAIGVLCKAGALALADEVAARLLGDFREQPQALAEALVVASRMPQTEPLLPSLARAFRDALRTPAPNTREIEQALEICRRLASRRKTRKRKQGGARKPRTKRRAPSTDQLPF